jgi:SOS response regulatory protein OraA/RecX
VFYSSFFLTKCQLFEILSIMRQKKDCLEAALAFLARREHAVKALRTKLMSKEYAAAEVDQVIDKLIKNNMLSDSRYAAARARYRATVSRWGAGRITQELKAQGVCTGDAQMALERLIADGIVMQDVALMAVKRAKLTLPPARAADPALGLREKMLARQKAHEKLLGKLLRKGFTFSEAKNAIAEAEAETE